MSEKNFVNGVWLDSYEFDSGDIIIRASFNVGEFIDYLKGEGSRFFKMGNNGDEYLNTDIKKSKNGKWYMAVNTYKKKENPFDR